MKRSWMPLYIADYLADTAHLDNAASGSYLLLIMHYWQHGGLPDDVKMLRSIARIPTTSKAHILDILKPFFHDGWRHKRIDQELEKSRDISCKRSASASQRWKPPDANADAKGYAKGYAKPMHRARASQTQIYKDSLIAKENLNGAITKTIPRPKLIFNETETEQWKAWAKHYLDSGADMPIPIPHWETKKQGWYFPTEWPPSRKPVAHPEH